MITIIIVGSVIGGVALVGLCYSAWSALAQIIDSYGND